MWRLSVGFLMAISCLAAASPAVAESPFIQHLVSSDNRLREAALRDLSDLPADQKKEVVTGLIPLLKGTETDSRERAAEALKILGPAAAPAIPTLQKNLSDDFPYVRIRSAEALSKIGSAALPAFIEALKNNNNEVRAVAVQALVQLGEGAKPAIPILIQALQDREAPIRQRAASALENCGADAAPALMDALGDSAFKNRIGLIRVLGSIDGTPPHLPAQLVPFLSDPNAEIGLAATKALTRKGPSAIPAVSMILSSDNASARSAAAGILGDIGPEAATEVPALIKALKDQEAQVRAAAALALGKMRSAAIHAVPALREAAKDPDRDVAARALEALTRITVTTGGPRSAKVRDVPSAEVPRVKASPKTPNKQKLAVKLAPKAPLGVPTAKLIQRCMTADSKARSAAALALAQKGGQAVPALVKALRSKEPLIRQCLCEALGDMGPAGSPAASALVGALRDMVPEVRQSAAEAYWKVDSTAAVQALTAAAKEGDVPVRLTALAALGERGSSADPAVPVIGELLSDSSDTVRAASAQALKNIATDTAKKILTAYREKQRLADINRLTGELKKSTEPMKEAVEALIKIGPPVVPSVTPLLGETNTHARLAAAQILNRLSSAAGPAVPNLIVSLNDPDGPVRHEAAQALEKINSPQAQNPLRWYYVKEQIRSLLKTLHLAS